MNENLDFFLSSFADNVKEKDSSLLFDELGNLKYYTPLNVNFLFQLLKERKEVLDKIIQISKNPAIKVQEEEVIKQSSLSGKLTSESFEKTLRDPKLWREKEGKMVPYFVHSKETEDTSKRYENAFICLLIDEIQKDMDSYASFSAPLCESLEERYQSKGNGYGPFSCYHDLRKRSYPYQMFLLREDEKRNDVLLLLQNCQKKCKNLRQSKFYKTNSKEIISKNIYPTNILLHDKLYSYCFRFYLDERKSQREENQSDYETYVVFSFLYALKKASLLQKENMPSVTFLGRECQFASFSFSHYPFSFCIEKVREGIKIHLSLHSERKEIDSASYLLWIKEKISKEEKTSLFKEKEKLLKMYDRVTLITKNNLLKEYDEILTLTPYKKDGNDLLLDYLSSLTMLFKASGSYYQGVCPLCLSQEVSFDGKHYHCLECGSEYSLFKLDDQSLLYLRKGRSEHGRN